MDIHRCRFVDSLPYTITATAFSLPSTSENLKVSTANRLRLAVGRSNGDIEIWNPKHNWIHELTLPGSRGRSIEGLVWSSPNNEIPRLFSIGGSTYITEWDLSTGKPKTNYDCNAGVIWSIDINDKNDKLAVGCDDGSVVIIDISGGVGSLEHDIICQRQSLRVLSLKWFESEMLIGGCSDARVRVWSTINETKGRLVNTMRVDKSKTEGTLVWSVMALNKKRQIVSGDSTGSVKFWDLSNFSLLQTFKIHEADVLCLTKSFDEEKIFTAGVDRKIHQFNLVTNKNKISKWIHSFNRLLHSNDIRSMSIFECKNYNFLISGGVEKSVVVQSVNEFHDGKYKKLSNNQQNIIVNEKSKIIIMWQDQTVKIWKISSTTDEPNSNNHKLIGKLSLADDENITSVSVNEDASLLAVSTLTSVKFFKLNQSSSKKLNVVKIRDSEFDDIIQGAKKVELYNNKLCLMLTPDDELYRFKITDEKIELEDEINLPLSSDASNSLGYSNSIKTFTISPNFKAVAISRFNGSIEILSLQNLLFEPYVLTKLTSSPILIKFNHNSTLLVINEENKLYEYYTKKNMSIKSSLTSLLTPWSQRNSEFLPRQFLTLEEKPQGIFFDNDHKIWVYGSNWLSFFDLTLNIPEHKAILPSNGNRKRNRDGLSIESMNDDQEIDVEMEDGEESLNSDLRSNEFEKSRKFNTHPSGDKSKKSFWLTSKYRPILKVENFGANEIIVVERPSFTSSTPAFDLPRIKV